MSQPVTKRKLLVVDDTPDNIHVLMETLSSDYAIVAATNGEKALAMALAKPQPDLILLDVMMPGIDGYEVCRRLKEDVRTQKIPVVFVTALSDTEDESRGLSLGAVDYITKPIQPSIVKARVFNHLELKAYRDDLESLVERQVAEIADSHMSTIFAMSKLAESRDTDTGKHLERTQLYCKLLAETLLKAGAYPDIIDAAFPETIFFASPLHDIGKVGVPDAILCKPGKLTPEEFVIMQRHTILGSETLFHVAKQHPYNRFINMGLEIARSHHEKWDGTGYPDKKFGSDIPLCALIMAVCDVYDALTSKRCYKEPMPHSQAREIIRRDAGTHFAQIIVDAFLTIEGEFDVIREQHSNPASEEPLRY